jgi:hypothetical protein
MRSVRIALAAGLTLLVAAIGLALLRSPLAVLGTNGIPDAGEVARTGRGTSACQAGEVVPAGTSAVRLTLAAEIGPSVTVTARSGARAITDGVRGAGWTGASVTVPVQRVSRTTSNAEICFALGHPLEDIAIFGEHAARADALVGPHGEGLPGRMGVEYLRSGGSSWLSLVPTIARRMGVGHAWGGTWIVFALLAAMASSASLLALLALRELR